MSDPFDLADEFGPELVLPDFIANARGVVCAVVAFHGGTEADAMARFR